MFLLLFFGCNFYEHPLDGPVRAMVLVPQPPGKQYALKEVQIDTLKDLHGLHGSVATLKGGGAITIPAQGEVYYGFREKLRAQIVQQEGNTPYFSYLYNQGRYFPENFHSLVMLTAYYNVERTYNYFLSLGLKINQMEPVSLFYYPQVKIDYGNSESKIIEGHAFFIRLLNIMVFTLPGKLDLVPLPANQGVIAHEYAHAVFSAISDLPLSQIEGRLELITTAIEEGSADFIAFKVSGQPYFFSSSFPADFSQVVYRNLSLPKRYDADLHRQIEEYGNHQPGRLEPHYLGSIWAHALFRLESEVIPGLTGQFLYNFFKKFKSLITTHASQFDFTLAANYFISQLPDQKREKASQIFKQVYPALAGKIDGLLKK